MKVIKPLTLGILHRPFQYRGENRLCVVALGFFKLGEQGSRFLIESEQFPRILPQLPVGQPLDMVMPKGEAEFLLCGKAHVPDSRPRNTLDVGLRVGARSKVIRVFGNRQWYYGNLGLFQVSAPEPFVSMPLDYEHAFGGTGHAANPQGQGFYGNSLAWLGGRRRAPMPNLEYPETPIRAHHKAYRPAAFGPMDIMWEPRRKWVGTYDHQWIETRFPGLADDADMRLHNAAAEDQRQATPWRGGDAYQLRHLHPQNAELTGHLPDFRVRALVQTRAQKPAEAGSSDPAHHLLELAADTVWFFPESDLGVVVYRAQMPIAEPDATDVSALLLAYEGQQDPQRDKDYYIEQMALRMDRQTAAAHALNEAALIPLQPKDRRRARDKASQQADEQRKAQTRAVIAELENDLDVPAPDNQPPESTAQTDIRTPSVSGLEVPPELSQALSLEDIADGGVDLSAALQSVDEQRAKLEAERDAELASLDAQVKDLHANLDDGDAQSPSSADWEHVLKRAQHLPLDLHPAEGAHREQVQQLIDLLASEPGDAANATTEAGNLESMEAMQRAAARAQTRLDPERQALPDELADKLGHWLKKLLAEGAPLAGRDLTDVCAPGLDFFGRDLREVNFAGADLAGACFRDANLFGANFLGADLRGADFSGAQMQEANLSHCCGQGADFSQANLAQARLVESHLSAARFVGADLTTSIFTSARLQRADFRQALLTQTLMSQIDAPQSYWTEARMLQTAMPQAVLTGADFSRAQMERVICSDASAAGSCWRDCQATRCFFGGKSDFSGSSWGQALVKTCGFRGAAMQKIEACTARFFQCDFGNVRLNHADLRQAVLCKSLFSQALLVFADLRQADLHQAICRGADFTGADLSGASLVHADMSHVVLVNTNLRDVLERIA